MMGPPISSLLPAPSLAAACALALALINSPALRAEGERALRLSDMQVKAAFVLNFIRLTNWTIADARITGSDLPVCALANSNFSEAVRRAVTGQVVGNRSISFRVDPTPHPSRCRVVVVDRAQYDTARSAIDAVKNFPVLTIGNGAGLIELGGMFELTVQDKTVHFEASLDSIRQSHLNVSSRLLQLSRNLRKGMANAF